MKHAGQFKPTHGESFGNANRTPEYVAWTNIIQRCENASVPGFERWGGRGIRVCDRWRESYESFLADMGRRPSPKHSIDRFPDNDGNYEPGNCRWATDVEQARNTSANRIIKANGKAMCLAAWADETGLTRDAIAQRIDKLGWSEDQAVNAPPRPERFEFRGERLTLPELVELTGIPQTTLWRRIRRHGGDVEAAVAGYLSNRRGRRDLGAAA